MRHHESPDATPRRSTARCQWLPFGQRQQRPHHVELQRTPPDYCESRHSPLAMACRVPPNAILQEFEPKACGHGVTDALAIYAIDVLGPTRVFQLLSEGGIDHTLCADTVPCTTFAGSAPKFSQLSITISGGSGGRGSYLMSLASSFRRLRTGIGNRQSKPRPGRELRVVPVSIVEETHVRSGGSRRFRRLTTGLRDVCSGGHLPSRRRSQTVKSAREAAL